MFNQKMFYKTLPAAVVVGLLSSSAYSEQVRLDLAIEWGAPNVGGSADNIAASLNSTVDAWNVTVDLEAFSLTQPQGGSNAHIAQEVNGVFSVDIDSTSVLPVGVAPATGHSNPISDDYAIFMYNAFDISHYGAVALDDRLESDENVAPSSLWRFTRRLSNILPEMSSVSNEQIISALSKPGASITVSESFNLDRVASFSRSGVATIVSVSVDGVAVESRPAECRLQIVTEWQNGLVGFVFIKNETEQIIHGWDINLAFSNSIEISNSWAAVLAGAAGNFTARNLQWNGDIFPGQEINFGFQGVKMQGLPATTATIDSSICR